MINLFYLIASLLLVVKSADVAIRHASNVAKTFRLSKYVVGFLVVAVISILPETFISLSSVAQGSPSFGLGTLFGSNVADLTLVFAVIIFSTKRGIKVNSKLLKENSWLPFLLVLPIVLGLDGYYSRTDGALLILTGLLFYIWIFRGGRMDMNDLPEQTHERRYVNLLYLVVSMAALLVGSFFTVLYGILLATHSVFGRFLLAC
jgi:cation:H+ antiporter